MTQNPNTRILDVWDVCEKKIPGFKVLGPPVTDKDLMLKSPEQPNTKLKGLLTKTHTLTATQLHLLWETLVNQERRNYFPADPSHKNFEDLIKLCKLGLMAKRVELGRPPEKPKQYVFHVKALGVLEKLKEDSNTLRQLKKELGLAK